MATLLSFSQLFEQLDRIIPGAEPLAERIWYEIDDKIMALWNMIEQREGEAIANEKVGYTLRQARVKARNGELDQWISVFTGVPAQENPTSLPGKILQS